jgi:serine/threonine-protein kinase
VTGAEELKAGTIVGGYRVERVVGSGLMGTIYLAQSPDLPRHEALKMLNRDLWHDQTMRARFLREADVGAQLSHPNIVAVYRRGATPEGGLWIAMQYIDGTDAETALRQGLMTPARAVHVISEIAKALDYAHDKGVVHRDVKPGNFLLSGSPGRDERVFLGDFGIAHAGEDDHTDTDGPILATVAYTAPEVLKRELVDGRADLYALGCSLFRMLTGSLPFPHQGDTEAVIRSHLESPPPKVSAVAPGLPSAFDDIIARALAKDPADRFQSGYQFASAAVAALRPRPVPPRQVAEGRQQQPPAPAPMKPPVPQQTPDPRPQSSPGPQSAPARPAVAPVGPPAPPTPPSRPVGPPPRPTPSTAPSHPRPGQPSSAPVGVSLSAERQKAPTSFVDPVAPLSKPDNPDRSRLFKVIGAVLGSAALIAVITVVATGQDGDSSPPGSSTSSVQESDSSTPVTRNPGAEARLLSLLPPGYAPDACHPVDPTDGAQAKVTCTVPLDPGGDGSANYLLMADAAKLKSTFDKIVQKSTVVTCPGNIQSPGPWRRNASPQSIAGTVFCAQDAADATVGWSTEDQTLITVVQAPTGGPNLDQLYGWWSTHS